MPERNVYNAVRNWLAARGCWVMKTHGSPVAGGNPDLIACCGGRFVAFELKDEGEDATKRQAYVLREIDRAGGVIGVIHSVEEAYDVFRKADL